jgi:hypothetical protein
MKHVGLLSSAAIAFLITSTFVNQGSRPAVKVDTSPGPREPAGRMDSVSPALKECVSGGLAGSSDVWSTPTARRWLHCQPNHWRAMLLNR